MRKIFRVIAVIIFIMGILVLSFPHVQRILYTQKVERMIRIEMQEYYKKRDLEDLYLLMQEYNQKIYKTKQAGLVDPFSYESPSFDLSAWGFKENVMGHLDIPAMDIKLPVYLGATMENMKKGAVHLSNTSLHIGGENTNTVLAAHRTYYGAAMFQNIQMLKEGDQLFITNFWDTLTYEVTEIKIITPYDLKDILIQEGKEMLTLITCHPSGQNYQRYVVYCERVDV